MEIFNAIGLQIPKGKTLNDLAEDAERNGEASVSARSECVLHGRCWRIGDGLEVWTILYESKSGEVFYADCRPGFRARFTQSITAWSLLEDEEDGDAAVEGFTENLDSKLFFQLQNLTEVSSKNFKQKTLRVGLCGLAHRAEISTGKEEFLWQPLSQASENSDAEENDWRLCGEIMAFNSLRNPFSGSDLFWIYLKLKDFELEILINQRTLRGADDLRVGAFIKGDIWLQGHIVSQSTYFSNYEGVDWSFSAVDFWRRFKREN